mgnify:CR=1 FL=1
MLKKLTCTISLDTGSGIHSNLEVSGHVKIRIVIPRSGFKSVKIRIEDSGFRSGDGMKKNKNGIYTERIISVTEFIYNPYIQYKLKC